MMKTQSTIDMVVEIHMLDGLCVGIVSAPVPITIETKLDESRMAYMTQVSCVRPEIRIVKLTSRRKTDGKST